MKQNKHWSKQQKRQREILKKAQKDLAQKEKTNWINC